MTLLLFLSLLQDAKPKDKEWKPDESIALAKKALKEDSKPEDWRPALKKQVDGYVHAIEQEASLEGLRFVLESIQAVFDESLGVVRKAPAKPENLVLVESAPKSGKAKRILLVCESAEFDELHDAVVICLGDLKAKKIRKSLVIATGTITSEECEDCVVYAGGNFTTGKRMRHNTLLVLGKLEADKADDVVYINPGERKVNESQETRDVELPNLPKKK